MARMLTQGNANGTSIRATNYQAHADSVNDRIKDMANDDSFTNSWTKQKTIHAGGLESGDAILLTMEEGMFFDSDRRIVLTWDDQTAEAVLSIKQGGSAKHTLGTIKGSNLNVWVDSDDVVDTIITTPEKAAAAVKKTRGTEDSGLPGVPGFLGGIGVGTLLTVAAIGGALLYFRGPIGVALGLKGKG